MHSDEISRKKKLDVRLENIVLYLQDLPIELKRKNDSKKMCISRLASEFPEDCKFYPADTNDELHKVLCLPFRHICIYFSITIFTNEVYDY